MSQPRTSTEVDDFIARAERWGNELARLRAIALDAGLDEDFSQGAPRYSHGGRMILWLRGSKDYCAVLFLNGALLNDRAGILVAQPDYHHSVRQVVFRGLAEVAARAATLKAYIGAAIAVEKSGRDIPASAIPEEFRVKLQTTPALRAAFEALTPPRQRAYLLHFAAAKKAKTRAARIEKAVTLIMSGKGLDD